MECIMGYKPGNRSFAGHFRFAQPNAPPPPPRQKNPGNSDGKPVNSVQRGIIEMLNSILLVRRELPELLTRVIQRLMLGMGCNMSHKEEA
jgi:hypothetical protein